MQLRCAVDEAATEIAFERAMHEGGLVQLLDIWLFFDARQYANCKVFL